MLHSWFKIWTGCLVLKGTWSFLGRSFGKSDQIFGSNFKSLLGHVFTVLPERKVNGFYHEQSSRSWSFEIRVHCTMKTYCNFKNSELPPEFKSFLKFELQKCAFWIVTFRNFLTFDEYIDACLSTVHISDVCWVIRCKWECVNYKYQKNW